jgi:hypothetical protein
MRLLLECSALILPALIFKQIRGRKGNVKHPDWFQAMWTVIFMMGGAIAVSTYEYYMAYPGSWEHLRLVNIKTLLIAITGHGLFFPLLMNWVLYPKDYRREGRWLFTVDNLSPDAYPDKLFIKFKISWWLRLVIYLTLFILSVTWFVW